MAPTARAAIWLLVALFLTGAYLYAFPAPTIAYAIWQVGHLVLGLAFVVVLVRAGLLAAALKGNGVRSHLPQGERPGEMGPDSISKATPLTRAGGIALAAGSLVGLLLIYTGTALPYLAWLYLHIGLTVAGSTLLAAEWIGGRGWFRGVPGGAATRLAVCGLAVAVLGAGAWWVREVPWRSAYRIANPAMPPASMEGEGDGAGGPFFPSSARTTDGRVINADFFMQSESCQRCHSDIYDQWFSSAHHFSSFNNQWYRKSIEYMQEVAGVQSSKWCGGCHDPAVLFSGMMDTPVKEIMDRPEMHAGLGCVACHSIVAVDSTMGQGGYTLHYPRLSELAASENPALRAIHDFLVNLNPEPHRRSFIKPFMREQTADFCSTCHKVHLDVPINSYRWIRGFNDYDNWQASGVSGQGARSFYYPPEPQKCIDCHMPLVPSDDAGNKGGFVRSHRFPGANTALPFVNKDEKQLQVVKDFLKDDIVSVDIFALTAVPPLEEGVGAFTPDLATTFAVGEEAEVQVTGIRHPGEAAPVTAPLDRVDTTVRRGDSARVSVVARTKKVGHFFPGGTVDAFDVWIELKATDDRGRVLFWSGMVEDDGRGPVEPGAHFYRSLLVDADGNWINKRNAWAARALVYVRLIPPGAADTAHFRLEIPEDAGEGITLEARLLHRKFMWWNTQFAFAGVPDPDGPQGFSPHADNRRWLFTGDTSKVSGKLKEIPDLPILTLAEDRVTLRVLPRDADEPEPAVALHADDWMRWNDYGIGLLLQGDLNGAEAAFRRVTEIDPKNPDGWVNIGRVRVQEGNLEGAREVLERALALEPDLARAHYFFSRVLRGEGDLEEAIEHLQVVLAQYPKDRVALNDLGRNFFLLRRYDEATEAFQRVLAIDPEDLQAHYNLMLCYTGLGQEARAREHETRYLRFKADEAAQAITGPYRREHPHDNRERQAIHEHVTVPLEEIKGRAAQPALTGGMRLATSRDGGGN